MDESVYKAIEGAYYKKGASMAKLAASKLGSMQDGEDAAQNALAELLSNAKAGKHPGIGLSDAIGLFYAYTINMCKRAETKKAKESAMQDSLGSFDDLASNGAPFEIQAITSEEYREIVKYASSSLSDTDFIIFTMKFVDGMKHKDIAAAIGGGADERHVSRRAESIKNKIIQQLGGKNGQQQ